MRMITGMLILMTGVMSAPLAHGAESAGTSTAVAPAKPVRSWSAKIMAEHYPQVRADQEASTVLYLDGSWKFNDVHMTRVLQPVTKYQEIPVGESEVQPEDTILYHYARLVENWNGVSVRLRPNLTLPMSQTSNKQGVVSKPAVTVMASRKFFNRLTLAYQPFYRYHINRYKTTIGGNPLRRQSLGNTFIASLSLTDKISLSSSALYQYNWDEKSPYEGATVRAKGSYLFDVSAGYQVMENLGVSAGISQADSFTKAGRYEINIIDETITRYYFTLTASM